MLLFKPCCFSSVTANSLSNSLTSKPFQSTMLCVPFTVLFVYFFKKNSSSSSSSSSSPPPPKHESLRTGPSFKSCFIHRCCECESLRTDRLDEGDIVALQHDPSQGPSLALLDAHFGGLFKDNIHELIKSLKSE